MADFSGIPKEILAPILTAVLGGLGVVLQDWRMRRTRVGRRKLALEDASAQVAFAGDWWRAQQALGRSPEALQDAAAQASDWLSRASALVTQTELAISRAQPMTVRRLLLLDPLDALAAKVFRVVYFACLAVTFQSLGTSLSHRLMGETDRPAWVDYYLIIGGVAVALALVFRILALEAEDHHDVSVARGEIHHGFIREALLGYPFHRTSARAVRLLFYLGLIGLVGYVGYVGYWALRATALAWLPNHLIACVVYGAAVVSLRRWAVDLEPPDPRQAPGTVPDALRPPLAQGTPWADAGTRRGLSPAAVRTGSSFAAEPQDSPLRET